MKYYSLSVVYGIITFVVVLISINQQMNVVITKNELEVKQWLEESDVKTVGVNSAAQLMRRFGRCLLFVCHTDYRIDSRIC